MNLARSSLKLFSAKVLSAGISIIGIVYFAREIGATQLGIYFLFQALAGILTIPADLGLRGAVEKRISEGASAGAFLSSVMALKAVPITLVIFIILIFQQFVNNYVGTSVAVLLSVTILLQEAAYLSISVLKGELRVGETAIIHVLRQVTWVVVGIFLVSIGFEAKGLIYALIVGMVVSLVVGWYKCSTPLGHPTITHMRSLFDYGRFNFISMVGGTFYGWMDVAIIGLFLSQAHVGAYEVAWRIATSTTLLSNAIASTIFPQVSRWEMRDSIDRIEQMIQKSIMPSMILVVPAFIGTVFLSEEILELVFGPEFAIASMALIILMGEKIIQSVHTLLGRSLQGINRPDLAAISAIIAMGVNLVLNVLLVLQFGIVGAAVATAMSFILNSLIHAYYLSKFVKINLPTKGILGLLGASSAMGLIIWVVTLIYDIISVGTLGAVVALGVLMYGVFLLFIPPTRQMIFEMSKLALGDSQVNQNR